MKHLIKYAIENISELHHTYMLETIKGSMRWKILIFFSKSMFFFWPHYKMSWSSSETTDSLLTYTELQSLCLLKPAPFLQSTAVSHLVDLLQSNQQGTSLHVSLRCTLQCRKRCHDIMTDYWAVVVSCHTFKSLIKYVTGRTLMPCLDYLPFFHRHHQRSQISPPSTNQWTLRSSHHCGLSPAHSRRIQFLLIPSK